MAHVVFDRGKETTTTTGTGAITLAGAVTGYVAFSSAMSIGDTTTATIAGQSGSEWETGIYTYSALNTLTRTTVLSSSNAGSAVNFSAGVKDVFCGPLAKRLDPTVAVSSTNTAFPIAFVASATVGAQPVYVNSAHTYNPSTGAMAGVNSLTATPVGSGAGNSLTITGGNGSGVGAGGNIILQPGAQGTSGGDGIIQCTKKLQFYTGSSKTDLAFQINNSTNGMWYHSGANMFVWTINNTDSICFRQGYIRLSKGGGIYWSNTTNDAITLPDDTSIYSASRGVFAVDAPMQSVNPQGGSLAFKSFATTQTANVNDWVMGPSAFQRVNCTTASSITGIAPYTSGVHVDGRMIRIYNVGTANLTLAHNNASSTAANRMYAASAADVVITPNQYVEAVYDATGNGSGAAGWRISSVH